MAASLDITSLENMNALMAGKLGSVTISKTLISPYIQNPATEPGAARTFGGGNQTLNGLETIIGRDATQFTGAIYQETQSVAKTLKKLSCERNLGVYLIDEYGNIGCNIEVMEVENAQILVALPIPVRNFFIGDKNLGGFEEPDSNIVQWNFLQNWSDDLTILKRTGGTIKGITYAACDYNPVTDLINISI